MLAGLPAGPGNHASLALLVLFRAELHLTATYMSIMMALEAASPVSHPFNT